MFSFIKTSFHRFPIYRLALAVIVAAMWMRSHYRSDLFALFVNHGKVQLLGSDRGKVLFCSTNIPFGDARSYTYDRVAMPNDEFVQVRDLMFNTLPLPDNKVGLSLGGGGTEPFGLTGAAYHYVIIPYAYFAVIAGALLARGFLIFWRRRFWGMPGTCAACGYDVRFSTDRCPECGHPLPTPVPQAAV